MGRSAQDAELTAEGGERLAVSGGGNPGQGEEVALPGGQLEEKEPPDAGAGQDPPLAESQRQDIVPGRPGSQGRVAIIV